MSGLRAFGLMSKVEEKIWVENKCTLIKSTRSNKKLIGKILVDFIINLSESPVHGFLIYSFNNNVSMGEQV